MFYNTTLPGATNAPDSTTHPDYKVAPFPITALFFISAPSMKQLFPIVTFSPITTALFSELVI